MPRSRSQPTIGNLPAPLSTFIGREREIADVKQLLRSQRLVTLTGPGGSGKTRLALQVANELQEEYGDGVWLAELASLSDEALVTQTIAAHLNVHEQSGRPLIDTLADHLSSRQILLVVDNCEHLINACAQFSETILQKNPHLHILATSRQMLGVPGESVFTTPPLTLPEERPWKSPASAEEALAAYGRSEAVQLFVNRANALMNDFDLSMENGAWVSEICRRLDGMPLAIELAAARVPSLSIQQIAQRLDDRFHLLTGGSRTAEPKQQTLAATLDWSYALCSEAERKVLQRLSVFSGGWTLDAAETVCAGEGVEAGDVLDLLSLLVDKSLVVVEKPEGGETRYRLLETIRQYVAEKLAYSGELDESRNRHLSYFVDWTEHAIPHLFRQEVYTWLNRLEAEHDNIRAALEWSHVTPGGAPAGLQLAATMGYFWQIHAYHTEGRTRLAAALDQKANRQRNTTRSRALYREAVLAFHQSDYQAVRILADESLAISREIGEAGQLEIANALEILAEVASETGQYTESIPMYEQALALYRKLGNLVGIGDTLKMLGWTNMRSGDFKQAESWLNEGLIACRESGDLRQITSALAGLGELALRRGQYDQARKFLNESLDISQQSKEKWGWAIALGSLGWIALRQHDYPTMRKLLKESLAIRTETGDQGGIAWSMEKLAEANFEQFQFHQAATIFGSASTLRASVNSAMDAADQPDYERAISSLKSKLGEQAFAAAWADGQAMTIKEAIDYALAEPEQDQGQVSLKEKFGGLTEREREVAALIAQGKSNREIAQAMTVGVKTIETYVTRILSKLDFDSRVQVATWAVEKGFDKKERQ